MFSDNEMLRVMARRYRWLAEQQSDLDERKKFLAYASIYDEFLAWASIDDELSVRREGEDSFEQASVPELKDRAA